MRLNIELIQNNLKIWKTWHDKFNEYLTTLKSCTMSDGRQMPLSWNNNMGRLQMITVKSMAWKCDKDDRRWNTCDFIFATRLQLEGNVIVAGANVKR